MNSPTTKSEETKSLLEKHKNVVFSSNHYMPTSAMPCEITEVFGMYGKKKYKYVSEETAILWYLKKEPENN